MNKVVVLLLLFSIFNVARSSATDAIPKQSVPSAARPAPDGQIVAVLNGQPIKASELDRHVAATRLPREEALEDLIDLKLVRAAAASNRLTTPAGVWSDEQRAGVEYALAQALALNPPAPQVTLVVDHAWLKDAVDEKEQAAGRAQLERLRVLVAAGATIPQAYARLRIDGTPWHIGDHEEYPAEVLPAEVSGLPSGSLSGIIPGDGGLHLFKIYQIKQELPPSGEIHGLLLEWLRREVTIEYP